MGFKRQIIIGAAMAAAALTGGNIETARQMAEVRADMAQAGKQQPGTPTRTTSQSNKGVRIFGSMRYRKPHRYGGGIPMKVAQQKRASRKRKGIRKHKRNCGMRG